MSKRMLVIVLSCVGTFLILWPVIPTATGDQRKVMSGYPVSVRPDTLARGGAVWTIPMPASECARHGASTVGNGGVAIGLVSCDARASPGGWVQIDRVFEDPFGPTVLTIRLTPPPGIRHSLQSVRRDGRARMLLDGRPIWEARTNRDDGSGRYFAIAEPEILTTIVVRGRAQHALRFETEPGVLWWIAGIEIAAHPSPKGLRGIAYSPYRDCQTPSSDRQPRASDVDDDMARLVHASNAVRTYSAMGINARIVAAAAKLGQPVYAGAWLDNNAADESEIRALVDLARTARPAGLIVGNEYYLRHRKDGRRAVDYLVDRIRRVKAALPGPRPPVMTAEVDGIMFDWGCEGGVATLKGVARAYQPILDESDAVLVHIYPFWEGRSLAAAASLAAARYVLIRDLVNKRYPGKRVILGETGWPSAGARLGDAVPAPGAQRRYMAEFMQLADALAIDYFYFDAFDEGWKVDEPGHVGQHWGYADSTRAAKYDISGTLIPGPLLTPTITPPSIGASGSTGPVFPTCGGGATPTTASGASDDAASDRASKSGTIYSEWLSDDSTFMPVGWMGDVKKLDLFECDRSGPHGGDMAIRAQFSPDGEQGWAGVVWKDPASDWGKKPGGRDLQGFRRLTFWVRGERGGEVVEFHVGGVGGAKDPFRDTVRPARSSGPVILSSRWQPVAIDLRGADLTRVVGGFSWIASRCGNQQPISFFLDDVRYEAGTNPAVDGLARRPFYIYDDDGSACRHYAPSGFMGDAADLALNTRSTEAPFKGRTAIQVTYRPGRQATHHWAGIYWQDPANNWGDKDGGFDLSWATVLTFHARGRRGGEVVEFVAGGLHKDSGHYPDSLPKVSTGPIHLTKDWRRYSIDLRGRDLHRVAGGFGLALNDDNNRDGAEFFLDEIAYERR